MKTEIVDAKTEIAVVRTEIEGVKTEIAVVRTEMAQLATELHRSLNRQFAGLMATMIATVGIATTVIISVLR